MGSQPLGSSQFLDFKEISPSPLCGFPLPLSANFSVSKIFYFLFSNSFLNNRFLPVLFFLTSNSPYVSTK